MTRRTAVLHHPVWLAKGGTETNDCGRNSVCSVDYCCAFVVVVVVVAAVVAWKPACCCSRFVLAALRIPEGLGSFRVKIVCEAVGLAAQRSHQVQQSRRKMHPELRHLNVWRKMVLRRRDRAQILRGSRGETRRGRSNPRYGNAHSGRNRH